MIELSPSLLSADFGKLHEEIKKVEASGIKYLHFDVMDGHFVPNITIGPPVIKALRKQSLSIFDVHLMIENPDNYIETFKNVGADIITVHYEACVHLHRSVQLIKKLGAKAGVSINPATSVDLLEDILPELDIVLIMSVNPGFGGQKFIPNSLNKISKLKAMIDKNKLNVKIEVDGGVNIDNIQSIVKAGAEILVAGASVFETDDVKKSIDALRAKINS